MTRLLARMGWAAIVAGSLAAFGCDRTDHKCTTTPGQQADCAYHGGYAWCLSANEQQWILGGGSCFPERECMAHYCIFPNGGGGVSDSLAPLRACFPDSGPVEP